MKNILIYIFIGIPILGLLYFIGSAVVFNFKEGLWELNLALFLLIMFIVGLVLVAIK